MGLIAMVISFIIFFLIVRFFIKLPKIIQEVKKEDPEAFEVNPENIIRGLIKIISHISLFR